MPLSTVVTLALQIAFRAFKTAKRIQNKTVAVHLETDARTTYVGRADEAYNKMLIQHCVCPVNGHHDGHHSKIQVVGDKHCNVPTLPERKRSSQRSSQRRNQKVTDEDPVRDLLWSVGSLPNLFSLKGSLPVLDVLAVRILHVVPILHAVFLCAFCLLCLLAPARSPVTEPRAPGSGLRVKSV
jgi:hypothetical protein